MFLAAGASSLPGYRLPGDIRPIHYIVEVKTELEDPKFSFTGEVWVKVDCIQSTNSIIMHANKLDIAEESVTVKEIIGEDELGQLKVAGVKLVPENEFLLIKVDQALKQGKMYIVHIAFKGNLTEDLAGYYRSSYFDWETNSTKWLAVTQFQDTDARRAFPCFDEPEMKARFTIRLAHRADLRAASNMPLAKSVPYEGEEGYVWSHFEDSLPMSTYLVAYMVSDFGFKTSPPKPNNVTFRIWSRKGALSQTEFASQVGPDVLEYFEQYFDVKYPLPKQDMAAIPDFSAGAMENWGLVTYRETALLYDDNISSKVSKHRVAYVIAHELAHQWFGNLVTMKWWTDLWLNEGFATYVGTLGVDKLFPQWNYLAESVLDFVRGVYDLDSLKSSHPVSAEIGHPSEISQIFDTISYKKGCSILRMMHLFLGDSFRLGVTNYLKKHRYGNAEQDDLWESLTEQAHKDGTLDTSMTVKEVMDSWTLQTGYPLIRVSRDYEKGTASLTQKRYLKIESDGKERQKDPCWWVPLTYTTQDKPNFNSTSPQLWLNCKNQESTQITDLDSKSWLILNVNVAGLYRVHYDEKNWNLISDALNSDQYSQIAPLNRADILLSVFDLAKTGEISYETTLSVAGYLERETEYLPWSNGLRKLGGLATLLGRTANYGKLQAYLTRLLTPIYKQYNQLMKIPNEHEKIQLHTLISRWAVELELGDSLKQVQELFAKWMAASDPDKENPVPRDLRNTVYCKAVWFGGPSIWDFLWQRYLKSNVGSEQNTILYALGCSRDIWILNRYLEWSIDEQSDVRKQDSVSVFSVIANQNIGYYVACDFLQRRVKDIYAYHTGKSNRLGHYLDVCGRHVIFEEEYKAWKDFIDANKVLLKDSRLAAEQSLETALANTNWYKKNYQTVSNLLTA